ncbi:hypothetical protein L1049_008308 [Liquidambar formosana]|uniref:Legume lectin domain-containing protein n=1 Tax=Liquidambar formosana TaxID=63359 RepID=A0AAP0S421_LIQFO
MSYRILVLFLLARLAISTFNHNQEFIFSGDLNLDGTAAEITPTGSVKPINAITLKTGQVFYSLPFQFKNSSAGAVHSFSTSFVFSINIPFPFVFKDGISLVISPSKSLPGYMPIHYTQLSNDTKQENISQNIFSIKLGESLTFSRGYEEIDNHVGININGVALIKYSPLGYFTDMNGGFKKLEVTTGETMQVWVEYDGRERELNVTLSPTNVPKPSRPLLSTALDLSLLIFENMYIGISVNDSASFSSHYILGWSFKMNGLAQDFDRSQLAKFAPIEASFRAFGNCACFAELFRNCSWGDEIVIENNRSLGGGIRAE